jgi:hypothetical protein
MKSVTTLLSAALILSACDIITPDASAGELPFFGDGYRAEGDQCRRVGENRYTNQFLDDSADLVGCPADYEGLNMFVADSWAVKVAEQDGYILYSVPRG